MSGTRCKLPCSRTVRTRWSTQALHTPVSRSCRAESRSPCSKFSVGRRTQGATRHPLVKLCHLSCATLHPLLMSHSSQCILWCQWFLLRPLLPRGIRTWGTMQPVGGRARCMPSSSWFQSPCPITTWLDANDPSDRVRWRCHSVLPDVALSPHPCAKGMGLRIVGVPPSHAAPRHCRSPAPSR